MSTPGSGNSENQSYATAIAAFSNAVLQEGQSVGPYSDNYKGVHALALHNIYQCVRSLLGDAAFMALSRVYVRHYRPTRWDLNVFGERFYELVAAQIHGSKADAYDWEALSLLALIEYAITVQYYADTDVHHGGEAILLDAPSSDCLSSDWLLHLAALHPYADIVEGFMPGKPIAVWREGLRIKVMSVAESTGTEQGVSDE